MKHTSISPLHGQGLPAASLQSYTKRQVYFHHQIPCSAWYSFVDIIILLLQKLKLMKQQISHRIIILQGNQTLKVIYFSLVYFIFVVNDEKTSISPLHGQVFSCSQYVELYQETYLFQPSNPLQCVVLICRYIPYSWLGFTCSQSVE